MTTVAWLVCIIAAIGFAFDIYELLMLPLILRPALLELVGATPGTPLYNHWLSMLFYVPAFAGGIFGLLGGYLTDWLGRRRVLTWSILLYAFGAFFAGFSTSIWMLLFFRCCVFIGVCVEFVAAVAWLAELFPNPQQRERALGYTQAFSSVGGLMVAIANGIAVEYGRHFPAIAVPEFMQSFWGTINPLHQHAAWRYTLMSGLIPALPLILIRPFLPESPAWQEKRRAGKLQRPSIAALFAPDLRKATIFTAIGFACSLGIAFGAIQQMPQIVPGLKEVRAEAKAAGDAAVEKAKATGVMDPKKLEGVRRAESGKVNQKYAAEYTKMQEVGGLVGRFIMAVVLGTAIAWGWKLRMFQLPGLIFTPLLFYYFIRAENTTFFEIPLSSVFLGTIPVTTMSIGIFLVGLFTVGQLSFWGNYLPHLYPLHLRGTGESFAANVGGRMIGTLAAALTGLVSNWMPFTGDLAGPMKFSTAAAIVGGTICLLGLINSFFLPEPKGEHLPD
jgi:MFS family permease